jgi:hypothetical protein
MDGRDSIQSLLVRRKLTRAIAEAARTQMLEYLTVLAPLLRPRVVLGDFVHGASKETVPRAERTFKDLQALYATVAAARPFNLAPELSPPLNFSGVGLDITPVDYPHVIKTGSDERTIMVRRPLSWVLTYSGFGPSRLADLLSPKQRTGDGLQQYVLGQVLLAVVIANSQGLVGMCEALHFPVTTTTQPATGALPVTRIGLALETSLPSDEVILESAALTGMDAFEEVVDLTQLQTLRDPLKDRLLDLARQHVPELV